MSVLEESGVPQVNLKTVVGDTFIRTVAFKDAAGNALDITGWTLFMTAKDSPNEGDGSAEVSVNVTAHTDAASGLTQITISAAAMATLGAGEYDYDMQVKKDDDTIQTILIGKLIVEKQYTVRTS